MPKIITNELVRNSGITPLTYVKLVEESFLMKESSILPPKISIHPTDTDFFNTMPVYSDKLGIFCLKMVRRLVSQSPALGGIIQMYDSSTGDLLALADCSLMTTMRTGAVAALTANKLSIPNPTYGFIGLGNTARATLKCLLELDTRTEIPVSVLRYKDQVELFKSSINDPRVVYTEYSTPEEVAVYSNTIFSCITNAESELVPDFLFNPGTTLIPVHTKGFQSCDLTFDKVFADDIGHVKGFKNFYKFKYLREFSQVLKGQEGRSNNQERILCYNIGIALHDAVVLNYVYNLIKDQSEEFQIDAETEKFYL